MHGDLKGGASDFDLKAVVVDFIALEGIIPRALRGVGVSLLLPGFE